jgi:hypothetical protein
MADGSFVDAVTNKLTFLLSEYGFRVTEASEYVVLLETPALCVQAAWDPRGEVSVDVFRRGHGDAGRWSFNGMAGRASVERLLELAGEAVRAEPAILTADPEFYEWVIASMLRCSTALHARVGNVVPVRAGRAVGERTAGMCCGSGKACWDSHE